MWHGYFVIERGTIGAGNWTALQGVFEGMGSHDSPLPAWNNHRRSRLDGDAVIYESRFEPDEVSIPQFKQVLADEFSIDVGDIEHTTDVVVYGDYETTVWEYLYNSVVRFTVRRFGRGGSWAESGNECRAYLAANMEGWESDE